MHPPDCLARRIRITTAVWLVPLLLVTSLPACVTLAHRSSVLPAPPNTQPVERSLSEWSHVEALRVGTNTEVHLHEAEVPPNGQRVRGRFHAATPDAIMLTLDDGQIRTLAKSAVYKVLIPRPFWKQPPEWFAKRTVFLVGMLSLAGFLVGDDDLSSNVLGLVLYGLPVGTGLFLLGSRPLGEIYEALPEASWLITQVRVPFTDGDVVPRHEPVAVSVAHASRMGRPRDETIGLTVCLSSRPDRCTGGRALFEGPAGRLADPVTATLKFGDEPVPLDTPMSVYVHVVLTSGPSWRPAPDQAVPQLGDPDVLDVETVTRRITVVDQ